MSNNTYTPKETSFWKFIQENNIEIPIIQRDYAQGRLGRENLRKNFLGDLKKALDNESPYKDRVMKLDFVYGAVEHNKMNPLDGQQRLTTLWLLHWYIALRAGKLDDEVTGILKKFTYETRISSRNFCDNLCQPEHFKSYGGKDIVSFITVQTWFYSAWKQDPTIQSMLRMLGGTKVTNKKGENIVDGIEELFEGTNNFENYWGKLTSNQAPIVFYHLPLKDFGLSDDLYIKMNARGKQLTSFENFKADLVNYITEQTDSELLDEQERYQWKELLDAKEGIPIKLDTVWTDIFWEKSSSDNRIDEIYFAFLNRFFWDKLFMAKNGDNYILDIGKDSETSTKENENATYRYLNNSDSGPNDYDTTISYEGFAVYRFFNNEIPKSYFVELNNILNRYALFFTDKIEESNLLCCGWDNDFRFVPEYEKTEEGCIEIEDKSGKMILKATHLNLSQRVVFHAVCKYLNDGEVDIVSLKRWMRFVWNMVSDNAIDGRPTIRSANAMRTAMALIDKVKDSHNVYECLRQLNNTVQGDNNTDIKEDTALHRRFYEEVEKAKKIMNTNGSLANYDGNIEGFSTWEDVITYAENHAFFRGSIRFLIRDGEGQWDWKDFNKKFYHAKEYFDKTGVVSDYKIPITKALIMQCSKWWEQVYNLQIFNTNSATWNWILGATRYIKPIHSILMADNLDAVPVLKFEEPEYDMYVKKELLPFDEMVNSNPNGRFRLHHDKILGYYKPYGQDAITFDWNNFNRNKILSELCDGEIITTFQRIKNTSYFHGWNIDFKYNGQWYQWYYNNHIYLMIDSQYCSKNKDGESEEERYYCFDATSNDAQMIVERLNILSKSYLEKEAGVS